MLQPSPNVMDLEITIAERKTKCRPVENTQSLGSGSAMEVQGVFILRCPTRLS